MRSFLVVIGWTLGGFVLGTLALLAIALSIDADAAAALGLAIIGCVGGTIAGFVLGCVWVSTRGTDGGYVPVEWRRSEPVMPSDEVTEDQPGERGS